MSITIYHNPRCSKSRQTLQLIRDHGIEPQIVNYLDNPPDVETLKSLLSQLNLSIRDIVRSKEDLYQTLNLAHANDEQLMQAVVDNPSLLERPIVVTDRGAAMGRPPENILSLLEN